MRNAVLKVECIPKFKLALVFNTSIVQTNKKKNLIWTTPMPMKYNKRRKKKNRLHYSFCEQQFFTSFRLVPLTVERFFFGLLVLYKR